ncbi:hypothetical protein H9Q74_012782 [Fusarium xylarioides]|nr:hypothetical protein H9Q71_012112 [Fusarium xylarioides]KAG5813269.1 hypothetical protein H9Q74_012782 [Fusarium xylarioides]
MRGAGNVDYVPGYEVNEPITNFSIAKVIRLDNDAFEEGSLIAGSLPIAEYAGMMAWNSFYSFVKPVKGKTIWVNAALSSVSEVVVQLAKIEGMKVIASVSSDDKLDYVINELGADVGFNYRKEPVGKALKRLAPDGLDVVFENVSGDHFQAAIENMKWFGCIISCGINFKATMLKWVLEGKIKSRYTQFEGIEQANKAFLSMFSGGSHGKTVLKISDP